MKYTQHNIKLKDSYDGKLDAILYQAGDIKESNSNILYIHGFNDYFFHDHVADRFLNEGYNFFALNLRRYGSARKENQKIFFVKNIKEYYEEIIESIKIIEGISKEGIILFGHSTGGLITTLFANEFQTKYNIKAMVLNSPFYDIYVPNIQKKILKGFSRMSSIFPYLELPQPKIKAMGYAMSLHKKYHGEWDYDFRYKTESSPPIYTSWVKAILDAQEKVKKGLGIKMPVLLLHSDKSFMTLKYKPEAQESDIILDVEDMKKYGPNIGSDITLFEVENAVHDVYLSKKEVRYNALDNTISWLKNKVK